MIHNSLLKLILYISNVTDIDSYKRVINRLITFLIVFGLCISLIAMYVSYYRFEKNSEKVNKELLANANSILQSNISEKLSIIVNNQDFVSYINEGEYSRKLNTVSMMFLFNKFIDNDLILGLKVNKIDNGTILNIGDGHSSFYVNLNLCYLNGQINNRFGNCYARMIIFMSKNSYLNRLAKVNSNIKPCDNETNKCDTFNPFISREFGSFPIDNSSKKLVSIKHITPSRYQLFIPAIIISIISTIGLLIAQRLIKLLTNRYLANPIKEIETNLKDNMPLKNEYIKEIHYLAKEIEEYKENKFEIEIGKNLAQVAHDMRSPLLAVDSFFRLVEKKLDESERFFGRIAIRRLDDIAWSLLSKFKNKNINDDENSHVFLHSCIQEILSEKRMEYAKQNIEFEFMVSSGDAFTLVYLGSINLKRMLSNIINNAVNAIVPNNGLVEICLEVNFAGALISIKDNGKGMSPDFINEILVNCKMEKAKTNLGLPHAIEFVEQVEGKLEIISNEGNGTTVNISLPPCETPFWCISEYHIQSGELLIFIDDSKAVHDVWDEMLRNFSDLDRRHFYNALDALSFLETEHKKLVIFCDYEFFDEDKNGLYILENAPNDATKILVTSCLYNPQIMKEAIEKGFKILPKDLVPYFKIRKKIQTSQRKISLIFIDDEPRNTQSWEFFAETKKLKIVTYNDINAFFIDADNFEKDIPVYIDLDLQSEKSGIDYAKDIHKKGFQKIYITTGAIDFEIEKSKHPWISEIQEKRFPLI